MKTEKPDVNALILGIRMNFEPVCGKERAEEAVDMVKELQRLATKGLRAEQAEKWLEEQIDLCERLDRLPHNDRYRRLLSYRDCLDRLKGVSSNGR